MNSTEAEIIYMHEDMKKMGATLTRGMLKN